MITEYLEQCCHLLAPENYMDEDVVRELVINPNKLKSKYIVPFRKELDKNILERRFPEEKSDLIIYYITELVKVQGILPDYSMIVVDIPDHFNNLKYSDDNGDPTNLPIFKVNRHYFYVLLFYEIQKACFSFKIPFLKLCRELWFQLNVIDTETSDNYERFHQGKRPAEPIPSAFEKLRADLLQKGFNELRFVKALSDPAKEKLISLLHENELPYQVAMLDYLGYFDFLTTEYGLSKNECYKRVGELLGVAARSVKGNNLVLKDYSREDRQRYTSHKYKDQVKNDYMMLK